MVGVSCTRGTFRPRCNPVSPYHVGGHLQGPICHRSKIWKHRETTVCAKRSMSQQTLYKIILFFMALFTKNINWSALFSLPH